MDPITCPFTPGAGAPPRALVGRDTEIADYKTMLGRLQIGNYEQSLLVTGLRGVGKTVLLDAFSDIAVAAGWVARSAEATHDTTLAKLIAEMCRSALLELSRAEAIKERARKALGCLKSFTISAGVGPSIKIEVDAQPGIADAGDLARDLADLLNAVADTAKAAGRGVVFLIDEVQFLERADFEALIAALHQVTRKAPPLSIVGAGLPMLPRLAGDAKSYSERLFRFPSIGQLTDEAATDAIRRPVEDLGATITDEALTLLFELSGRYPYFLQEYGKYVWLVATGTEITKTDVENAHPQVEAILDSGFFRVRFERATDSEQRYLVAMANLGDGPYYPSGDVTRRAGYKKTTETGPTRDSLIKKGLIYGPRHGQVAFTAPHFAAYLRRLQLTEGS